MKILRRQAIAASLLLPGGLLAAQPPLASPEQIRACLESQDELREKRGELMERIHAHEQSQDLLKNEMAMHALALKRTDTSDTQALQGHSSRLQQLDTEVRALNLQGAQLRQQQASYNQFARATNLRCDAMRYRMSDYLRVLNERLLKAKVD